ncbi:MAG: hypothetical protein ACJ8C4_16885 [Gemmataceae bacterium]
MDVRTAPEPPVAWQGLLGYLNFSDGRPDIRFQQQLHAAFQLVAGEADPLAALAARLQTQLSILHQGTSPAFRDIEQARSIIDLGLSDLPSAYLEFHSDLLAHQTSAKVFTPFFLARSFEALLERRQRGGDSHDVIVTDSIARLNDYVGYRPVPVLETRSSVDFYPHEKVRPVPLYLRGVGVAAGPYQAVVLQALKLLASVPQDLLDEAHFDADALDELAFDPRAYDHNHPANRRPNYVFGEWDPHQFDAKGRFSRYVVRQVILDLLLDWIAQGRNLQFRVDPETRQLVASFMVPSNDGDRLFDAGAVLAGTILMATMLSGSTPASHDSSVTLATLVPLIAKLRDSYYQRLINSFEEPRASRLKADAAQTRQPFGGARQALNQALARDRALHLQERHLAVIFAMLGLPAMSRERARKIHAPGVRFVIEARIRLTEASLGCERGQPETAIPLLAETGNLIQRGIDCGGLVDPWSILAFQGLYPLFQSREDAVHDPRIDELLGLMNDLFEGYSNVVIEAAAKGQSELREQALTEMQQWADSWDRFATHEVSEVRRVHGGEHVEAADHVATALARWRQAGGKTAHAGPSGSVAFWRDHLEGFKTPAAFARVVAALLERNDYPASMALLMTWLDQSPKVSLGEGDHSFQKLAKRWMKAVRWEPSERARLTARFFELLEANADEYWLTPDLESRSAARSEDEGETFEAAYEGMTFQDSTDDGFEGSLIGDEGERRPFSLEDQAEEMRERLRFLGTLAELLRIAGAGDGIEPSVAATWRKLSTNRSRELEVLLDRLNDVPLPAPEAASFESTVEYDRRREIKETLLEEGISAALAFRQAVRALGAGRSKGQFPWESAASDLERAIMTGTLDTVRQSLRNFLRVFADEPLLYIPLGSGGHPHQILRARAAQAMLQALLETLPRLGLTRESFQLTRIARKMEANSPPEGRRVTEFDRLFPVGLRTTIETLIDAIQEEPLEPPPPDIQQMLNSLTEPYLKLWLKHSQSLRLSILETVQGNEEWDRIEAFIRDHGEELFTAQSLNLANLRAVIHRGVEDWIEQLSALENPPEQFLAALDNSMPRSQAIRLIEIIFQAIAENYDEYKDYNTTTSQSDYGNNLFILIDYLRLKTAYERDNWRMRPLFLTHEILCRRRRTGDAARWQEVISVYMQATAQQHLRELERLETRHGVKLRTVRERLEERFVASLAQDRLAAHLAPLWESIRQNDAQLNDRLARFKEALSGFSANPVGAGVDTPQWIRRLEREIAQIRSRETKPAKDRPTTPPLSTLRQQLAGDWEKADDLA